MIDVLVVDDHAAVRAGLLALLRLEPGLVPVGTVGNGAAAVDQARTRKPNVVLLDYHLPDADGLSVCQSLRELAEPPQVVIYSAFADDRLALPAALVGAHAVLSKSTESEAVFETIRAAARGDESRLGGPQLLAAAPTSLPVEDLPVLGMLVDGTPIGEIAEVLNQSAAEIERQVEGIIERLRHEVDGELRVAAAPANDAQSGTW